MTEQNVTVQDMSERNMSEGHGRREIDDLLAALLATGLTYDEVAEKAGCSRNTVARRMKSARFRERVQAVRSRIVESIAGKLINTMTAATDALAALLTDNDPKTRLSAARSVLSLGKEFWDGTAIQDQLDRLNELLERRV